MKKPKQSATPLPPAKPLSFAGIVPWLVLLLVWIGWWWPVLCGAEQLYIRDLTFYALPMKTFMMERLAARDFPFWTPYISAGMPFFADPSNQVLYPGNLLFFLSPNIAQGISWFVILHHLLGLMGFFALGRTLRATPWLAVWGALLYGMAGYTLSILDNVNYLTAVAWAPWALTFFLRGLEQASLRQTALTAGCVGLMVLAGDTFHPLYLGLFCGLLVAVRHLRQRRTGDHTSLFPGASPRFAWIHLFGAFGLAGLLSAVQIIPTLELLRHSVRQEALDFEEITLWSFPPQRLVEFIQPFFYGSRYPAPHFIGVFLYPRFNEAWADTIYIGLIPILAGLAWSAARFRQALPWLTLVVAALILGFGYHAPYYPLLLKLLPSLSFHRYQEKFVFFATFGLCILALQGAAYWLQHPTRLWERLERHTLLTRSLLSLGLIIVPSLLFLKLPVDGWIHPYAMFNSVEWGSHFYPREPHILGLFHHWIILLALVIPLLWLQKSWYRPYFAFLLVAALVDLGGAHFHHVPTAPSELILNRPTPAALAPMEQDQQAHPTSVSGPLRIFYDDEVDYTEFRKEPQTLARIGSAYGISGLSDSYEVYWPYRVLYSQNRMLFNFGIVHNAGYLNGRFAPLQPKHHKQMDQLMLANAPNLLMALSNVSYIVTPLQPRNPQWEEPHYTEVGKSRPFNLRVLRVDNKMPRAYLAPNALWNDEPVAVYRIMSDTFRNHPWEQQVELSPPRLLNPDIPVGPPSSPTLAPPAQALTALKPTRIQWTQDEPGHLSLSVNNPYAQPAYLVVTESFFPGWQARVDRQASKLFLANQRFIAVPVPPGQHTVSLQYSAPGFRAGLLLSLLGLGLMGGCFLLPRFAPRWTQALHAQPDKPQPSKGGSR